MAIALTEMQQHLDECLTPERFQDYCPNGLQVEGRSRVVRLATGVTASQALIDEAIDWSADAILVHHGYFWRDESPLVIGMKRRRLGALLGNDISLLVYHLPLDAHPQLGNNVCFGRLMGVSEQQLLTGDSGDGLARIGSLPEAINGASMVERLAQLTGREPLYIGSENKLVRTVAWCTGAAQGYIDTAAAAGADMYITGEASEQTAHMARELGIQFIAAGHHATERYGVQAVGQHLAARFDIEHRYIDIDNPV